MRVVWELDFYSRPILDDRSKRRWEVVISEAAQGVDTDIDALFRFSKYLPSTEVNSIALKEVIQEAIAQAPEPPRRIRFFRFSMQNMIIRACEDLGIAAQPSRRTLALKQWLDYRAREVYPQEPGYTEQPSPAIGAPPPSPRPLPDPLIGQQWALVTLAARDFADMPEWPMDFGEGFPLSLAGVGEDAMIPGLVIFSPRAGAMAGWMSGLELSEIRLEASKPPRLILETGNADSWILATLSDAALKKEGENFEQAKAAANQVHFLAVQADPNTEAFAGFWLMQSVQLG